MADQAGNRKRFKTDGEDHDNNSANNIVADNNNSKTQNQSNNNIADNNNSKAQNQSNNNNNNNNNNSNNNNNNNNPRSTRRVYVANIPFDVKWSELKDLFRDKVGNVSFCTIFENEDGKSRGCGLVEFTDQASARAAIDALHRSEYKNRELVVKEDLDCERDRFGRIVNNTNNRNRDDSQRRDGNSNSGGGGGNNNVVSGGGGGNSNNNQRGRQMPAHNPSDAYGYDHSVMSNAFGAQQHMNTYGLSQQFLDSLSISLPLNNRIFVANLEYKVDQSKLEEIFKLAGRVARVKLAHDPQGQSRGYGTVEYEHPVEAVQAISMFNNQKLYGRIMSVRMDKYECEDDTEALPSKLPTGLESIGKGLGVGGQPLNINRSIMSAALVAPPHLATVGQPMASMHQTVQPAMHQAMLSAQMQQLQQQQHQVPQAMPQAMPQTMQQQMQQSLQQPLQQPMQQQIPQMAPQQSIQQTMPQAMVGSIPTYPTMMTAAAVRPTVSVYQQPQPQQPQQQQQQPQQQQQQPQQPTQQANPQPPSSNNLSVFSTFERQFRDASAQQNFSRS